MTGVIDQVTKRFFFIRNKLRINNSFPFKTGMNVEFYPRVGGTKLHSAIIVEVSAKKRTLKFSERIPKGVRVGSYVLYEDLNG